MELSNGNGTRMPNQNINVNVEKVSSEASEDDGCDLDDSVESLKGGKMGLINNDDKSDMFNSQLKMSRLSIKVGADGKRNTVGFKKDWG